MTGFNLGCVNSTHTQDEGKNCCTDVSTVAIFDFA